MDWHLLGNGVAALECALILAWFSRIGAKGLRKLPVPILIAFLSLASGTSIVAQKTNGVNNLPPMPMPPRSAPVVETVTEDDVARGWRVESVTMNETVSYTMPSNAVYVNNWHVHGARSSFGKNVIDFGSAGTPHPTSWSFPLGTNGAAFSSFWYFVDGRIRPTPKDAAREICAVGVPMSAVPGLSRLWTVVEDDDSRVLTWENLFLGGDTNALVNAQIRLFANGDFTTRSNNVETVCRRVNPDDWDGDGIINDDDFNPLLWDGDFTGPANVLPEGANTNAYCTVSVVATGPDALITFAGDGPSDYPDPRFIAKSGVTNDVVILIGKTYQVSSGFPISFVGASDPETEIVPLRGSATRVCRPVTITCSGGNPFAVSVFPTNFNGSLVWDASNCCSIVASDGAFEFQCLSDCECGGCNVIGYYRYEGYGVPFSVNGCGCNHDQANVASLSFSASPIAILFEPEHVEPQELSVVSVSASTNGASKVAGDFVGYITIAVLPSNVSFEAIQVKELGSAATNVFGYFSGMDDILDHGKNGANKWHGIGWHEYDDKVSISQVPPPWHQGGHFTWLITNAWRVAADITRHFPHRQKYDQTFELDTDGTVRIRKMGYVIQRNTNDVLTVAQEEEQR